MSRHNKPGPAIKNDDDADLRLERKEGPIGQLAKLRQPDKAAEEDPEKFGCVKNFGSDGRGRA